MSALAHILLERGCLVSGSDQSSSKVVEKLAEAGATVFAGHSPDNVDDPSLVVVTSAARDDNVEIVEARRRGLHVVKRAELLGALMSEKCGIAVAGTHGKTTTTAMISHVLQEGGLDPSFAVGGVLSSGMPHGHDGAGEYFVAEADEFDGSFLRLRPTMAVVTNIEADHLDFYGDIEQIQRAFQQFVSSIPANGLVVLNRDDERCAALGRQLRPRNGPTPIEYSMSGGADWTSRNVRASSTGGSTFEVEHEGLGIATVELRVPGWHNVSNALACIAICTGVGVEANEIAAALGTFSAVRRRFEIKGVRDGVLVVDDYAHHPSEIMATIQAVRQSYPRRRLWCVFQPHTYSRTKSLLSEFADALAQADVTIVTGVYAARESDTLGVSGEDIVKLMPGRAAMFFPELAMATGYLDRELRPGDVLLTLGAGDVWKVAEEFLSASERPSVS
ncbi:MAG: UDP-N-acetylmuramate--L-alanine ligase [Chloroflexi bacterium]|nr:UDP-N-acetylmuramate--L-alanine ligase [Chloroflexota bacterium]